MKKKLAALILLSALVLSLAACDGGEEGKDTTGQETKVSVPYEEETVDPSLDEIGVDLFD